MYILSFVYHIVEFCQCILLDDAEMPMLYWHSLGGIGGEKFFIPE